MAIGVLSTKNPPPSNDFSAVSHRVGIDGRCHFCRLACFRRWRSNLEILDSDERLHIVLLAGSQNY